METSSPGTASPGTAFRRLQQRNTRGHDYTECADDFHNLILRLNVAPGKYDDPPREVALAIAPSRLLQEETEITEELFPPSVFSAVSCKSLPVLFPQRFLHVLHHRAVKADRFSKIILGNPEFFGPMLPFPFFVNVDSVLIGLAAFGWIVWHMSSSG